MSGAAGSVVADPGAIWAIVDGYTRYWAVATALELDLFTAVAGGATDVVALADASGASDPRLEGLLETLVALGLLARGDTGYGLTPLSDGFLVAGRPRSMCDLVRRSPGRPENWPALAATLRGARPPRPVDDEAEEFYRRLTRATAAVQHAAAAGVVPQLGRPPRADAVVLDLGAGSGPWAAALLEAWPAATAICNDLPGVLGEAEQALAERGLSGRATLLPGDYHDVELPVADVVVLAHVLRIEGPARAPALVRRAADVLRPGGVLLVADYLVDPTEPSGSIHAALLGLTTVANTVAGAGCTLEQVGAWMHDAGLVDVRSLASSPAEVVAATQPSTRQRGPA